MSTVVASDLDRTLIYSRAAIDAVSTPDQVPQLLCVEWLDGREQSFMTVEAARWLTMVREASVFVPVTTRTRAQYDRVRLPGGRPRYAITSNGGHIVVDGASDDDWRRGVRARLAGGGASLEEIVDGLDRQATGAWVLNRKVADELFCYLVVDLTSLPVGFLDSWTRWCSGRGWVVSMQGRKIYALPRGLTKQAAITEVITRVGADRLLAAGDGALDAGFLSLAHAAIRPPHGELAESGWQTAHLRITDAAGVLAGEELTRWLGAQLGIDDGQAASTTGRGNLRQPADVSSVPLSQD